MSQNINTDERQTRVLFLDGMRGWASLMVLFSHLAVFFLANTVPGLKNWLFGFLSDGNFAVFIFFVLSGFALSINFIQTGKIAGLTSLALRRFLRLAIPIFFSALLAFLLMRLNLYFNAVAGAITGNAWTAQFFNFQTSLAGLLKFSFYDVFFHHNADASFNPALWTMSIELWGSFLVFSLCALFMRLRSRVLILGIIMVYLAIENNIWYLPFVSGMLLALVHTNYALTLNRYFQYLAPILIALVVYYSASTMRGGIFGLPAMPRGDFLNILAASALLLSATCTRQIKRFFENRLSQYLGRISFSLYLTHFMVLCSFSSYLQVKLEHLNWGWSREWKSALIFLASMVACIGVAHFFQHAENFAIAVTRKFSKLMMGEAPKPVSQDISLAVLIPETSVMPAT